MDRWRGPEGERLADEVFARLLAGKSLDDLGLGEHEGRVDLRGISAPIPARLKRYEFENWFVEELGELIELHRVQLEGLDFSGAFLDHLRFFHVRINDCRFDRARCQDWRMWAVDVTNSTFERSDLRRSALGPWHEGRGNIFQHVSF